MIWSDQNKAAFKNHLCDIHSYIFQLSYPEINVMDINIISQGEELKEEMKRRVESGVDADTDDEFCEFVIENGNKLLYVYYHQNKNSFPNDYDRFVNEQELVIRLSGILSSTYASLQDRHENEEYEVYHGSYNKINILENISSPNYKIMKASCFNNNINTSLSDINTLLCSNTDLFEMPDSIKLSNSEMSNTISSSTVRDQLIKSFLLTAEKAMRRMTMEQILIFQEKTMDAIIEFIN